MLFTKVFFIMNETTTIKNVLLIEDNRGDARLLEEMLWTMSSGITVRRMKLLNFILIYH